MCRAIIEGGRRCPQSGGHSVTALGRLAEAEKRVAESLKTYKDRASKTNESEVLQRYAEAKKQYNRIHARKLAAIKTLEERGHEFSPEARKRLDEEVAVPRLDKAKVAKALTSDNPHEREAALKSKSVTAQQLKTVLESEKHHEVLHAAIQHPNADLQDLRRFLERCGRTYPTRTVRSLAAMTARIIKQRRPYM